VLAGAAFLLVGFETRSRSITEIDAALRSAAPKEGVTP
jgi:hypothetical protein